MRPPPKKQLKKRYKNKYQSAWEGTPEFKDRLVVAHFLPQGNFQMLTGMLSSRSSLSVPADLVTDAVSLYFKRDGLPVFSPCHRPLLAASNGNAH